ncbi:MAG TPA: tetratricopeptide repeat protein [Longimicrobiales bacterium]
MREQRVHGMAFERPDRRSDGDRASRAARRGIIPAGGRGRRRPAWLRRALLAAPLAWLAACSDPEPALVRGDRLWADSNYTNALAEYRLALRQSGDDEDVLLRVAHAYAQTDQLERARESYERLLRRAPEYTDQAIHDFLALAERARERGDRFGVAGGVEAALALRRELDVHALAPMLARYHVEMGNTARALEFYQRALAASPPDSTPALLFEIALAHEDQGNCGAAVGYFMAYRQRVTRGRRAEEATWHAGNCAYELARQSHRAGNLIDALEQLALVTELGQPENIQDQAWFDRGEILYALGRFDEALDAYERVLELNRTRGGGQIVERAQRRIDDIRFRP